MSTQRDAKRAAVAALAMEARFRASTAERFGQPRSARAFTELAEELERRVSGERKPKPVRNDPDQLTIEDATT